MRPDSRLEVLSAELEKLKKENGLLSSRYRFAEKRIQELQRALKTQTGPNDFRATLYALKVETERLRSVYPVQDLLTAKESEIEKVSQALASITEVHSEFKSLDLRLKTHIRERDDLKSLVAKADELFKRQILRIRTAGLMVPFEVHTQEPKQNTDSKAGSPRTIQESNEVRGPLLSLLPLF